VGIVLTAENQPRRKKNIKKENDDQEKKEKSNRKKLFSDVSSAKWLYFQVLVSKITTHT